jgi:aminopeptidase N
MRRFLFLFFGFVLVPCVSAQKFKEPEYVKYERTNAQKLITGSASSNTGNYDWIYQRLVLNLDPALFFVEGETDVFFKFHNNDNRLVLDLHNSMLVQTVTYHGQPVSFSQNTRHELVIDFPSQIGANVLDSVHIEYQGSPNGSGFGSFTVDTHNGVPVLWTLSEPYGARDWWPCKQDLTDKLDSIDVILRYPAEINGEVMQGVSNGLLVNESVSGGVKTSHWRHRHPIPAYLVAVAITNYQKYSHQAGIYTSFPVDNYVFPEDMAYAQSHTPVIVDILNFFEENYGEYPYSDEKYGHAQFGWGGGMEHTTISFMGGFSRGLQAHELAHQWFGDDVTCGSWSDIWLNEGFATYSEALIQEHMDGDYTFYQWRRYANNLITQEPHESVYVYGSDTLNVGRVFSWELSYLKGAMVLHMLRFKTGDQVFFEIMQRYRNRFRGGYAKTDDFKSVVEEVTGEDYDEFFNDWVYGKGFPSFNVRWAFVSDRLYRVEIEQSQSDASVDFFQTPVRLRFSSSSHTHTYDTIVNLTQNNQVFFITTDNNYDELTPDPDLEIIRDQAVSLFTGNMEWNDAEIMIFPNPATDFIHIFHKNPRKVKRVYVFDTSGRIVLDGFRANQIIGVNSLANGVYYIGVAYKNGSYQAFPFIKL